MSALLKPKHDRGGWWPGEPEVVAVRTLTEGLPWWPRADVAPWVVPLRIEDALHSPRPITTRHGFGGFTAEGREQFARALRKGIEKAKATR